MKKEYHSGRLGHRHGLMVILFFGCLFMYSARVGLSVAMVAMTQHHFNASSFTGNDTNDVCPVESSPGINSSTNEKKDGKFDWDPKMQGILHGAFFYGYLVSQVPGGMIADKFGAKLPIAVSMFLVGILSIVSPFAAEGGVWLFFLFRLLIGAAQGVVFPSITSLWSQWAPPAERGRLLSITYSGSQIGTAFGMFLAGILADAFGWESVFYGFGILCVVWLLPWMCLAFNSPEIHPRISHAERQYIHTAIQSKLEDASADENNRKPKTPWVKIFKTVPFWALLIVEFGHNWGFYTLQTNLPTYMNNILHFSLKSNGLLSAMPYLVRWTVTIFVVFLADWMHTRKFVSPTVLRKIFSLAAFLGTAAALTGVGFAGCDSTLAVVLFATAIGMSGCLYVGYLINYTELSVTYAGTLIGIGNTVGTVTGIAAPYVVGVLTSGENGQTLTNWRIVFGISTGMYLVISTVYLIFGSAKRQAWNNE